MGILDKFKEMVYGNEKYNSPSMPKTPRRNDQPVDSISKAPTVLPTESLDEVKGGKKAEIGDIFKGKRLEPVEENQQKGNDVVEIFGKPANNPGSEIKNKNDLTKRPQYMEDSNIEEIEGVPVKRHGTIDEHSLTEDKEKEKDSIFILPKTRYIPLKKKNVITLVVENTSNVREYKQTVLKIISKIINDNKEDLFSIYRVGFQPKHFGIIGAEVIEKNNILNELLIDTDDPDTESLLYEVLKHVKFKINTDKTQFNKMEMDDQKYEIVGYSIILIGVANFHDSTNELSSEILKELKSNKKIKTIKYFCIDDKSAINAATIGFPVIGHIEANFYK